ncbi:unnamed protein product [Victoria cruziana]
MDEKRNFLYTVHGTCNPVNRPEAAKRSASEEDKLLLAPQSEFDYLYGGALFIRQQGNFLGRIGFRSAQRCFLRRRDAAGLAFSGGGGRRFI